MCLTFHVLFPYPCKRIRGNDVKFSTDSIKLFAVFSAVLRRVWHLGGRVFGAKTRLAGHVTFFNCKVPDWNCWIVEFYSVLKVWKFNLTYWWRKRLQSLQIYHLVVKYLVRRLGIICHCLVPSILPFAFCSAKERLAVISQISDHHFSGGYTVFHVWSSPVWNHELLSSVSLILCSCFAMSHVPFVRLCRGSVGRQLVKPIVTRNMASARINKVLVTRSVPQAAIEIIKSSQRYVLDIFLLFLVK